jgi:hypothetical protein
MVKRAKWIAILGDAPPRRLAALLLASIGVLILLASALHSAGRDIDGSVFISGANARVAHEELARRADLVLLVRPTTDSREHWNNAANSKWGTPGETSFIYRDDTLSVVRVLSGSYAEPTIAVRTVGGTSSRFRMVFDGQPQFRGSGSYIVFLDRQATPTKEGAQQAWVPVAMEQGVFEPSGSEWRNAALAVLRSAEPGRLVFDCENGGKPLGGSSAFRCAR